MFAYNTQQRDTLHDAIHQLELLIYKAGPHDNVMLEGLTNLKDKLERSLDND